MPNVANFMGHINVNEDYLIDPARWFREKGLPIPSSFPSAVEARESAKERSLGILNNYEMLGKILDRHEETIRKRWAKKTKKQQRSILLSVWPDMAPSHRSDFEALKREEPEDRERGTRFREWFLWPSINLEDLTLKKSLLLFLNARARNPPCDFAQSDFDGTRIGHACRAIRLPFLPGHIMFLDGRTVKTFGQLESREDEKESMELVNTGRAFDPGCGLIVLEIQQRIMEFLVGCCKSILHDLNDPGSLIDSRYPVLPALPAIRVESSEYPSTAMIAIERQYRVPAKIDFQRLRALVAAKRSNAEDHIWTLREDPAYFASTIADWGEHRRERIIDMRGQIHDVGPGLSQNSALFWERVIAYVISDAYGTMIGWNILLDQLGQLERLKELYSGAISPSKKLPAEYLRAILIFRQMLNEAQTRLMMNLESGAVASPPLRNHFIRHPQDPSNTMITIQRKNPFADDLLYILELLWDEEKTFKFGLPDLLDQLEHMADNDPQQKARLSTWVTDILSNLGLIAQLRNELDNYHPWAAGMVYEFSKVEDQIEQEVSKKFNSRKVIDGHLKFVSTTLSSYGDPRARKLYYPADKRRTRENNEAMQLAERNLDEFWKRVDQRFKMKSGKTLHEVVLGHLFENRDLERTQDWVEPVKEVQRRKKIEESLSQPFSELSLKSKDQSTSPIISQTPKVKVKTKGISTTSDPAPPEPQLPTQEDIQPTFTVDKRAYKVFSTLFFVPNQSDQPGGIAWADFLYALASTSFRPEKLYGSVWQFTPTKLDVERSIQFHEPHPHSKIPFLIARRIGRRLNRAYGWHSGMFNLA